MGMKTDYELKNIWENIEAIVIQPDSGRFHNSLVNQTRIYCHHY